MRTIQPDHVLAAMASLSPRAPRRPELPPAAAALLPPYVLATAPRYAAPLRAAA